ncbi:hypothetical protein NDU88_004915 [Pleurodeles waltl]|uniref:Uncharacterized protein n=1 Tax=Pleurodeles waltl TaxID=8319 RepID=A0AAV7NNP0_PLEWA|nr:hypothetical protein NDU88_004915 [Pleurodeles waltl]
MAVTSTAVRTVTAGVHRHWLLEPIGPNDNQCEVAGGLRPSTATAHNASRITSFPLVSPHRWLPVLFTQEGVPDHRCMLHNLALRRQVPYLQEDKPGDGLVAAVEPVDSEEEEAEDEDVDNRSNIIQQYFQ